MRVIKPLTAAVALAVLSNQAMAQAALEEVVVTAQKRTESLQDVPVAVVAVSGEKIAEAGIQGLTDLADYIPNVSISFSAGDSPGRIIIRGVGSGNNAGFEQSVGMFNDGVYQGRARQYLVPFLDVGSVEVLKGPQGTLYGKNTVAGAISVSSARPTDELEGRLSAQYEMEYGSTEYTGFVSGPLGDNVRGRLSGKYREAEGYVDNIIRDEDEPAAETSALRGSLVWDASDTVEVFTKLEYAENETTGGVFQITDTSGLLVAPFGTIVHKDVISPLEDGRADDKTTSDSDLGEEISDTDSLNGVVRVDWELATATLTSVTGYSEYDASFFQDNDFSDLSLIDGDNEEDFEQISQEFRLVSDGGESLDYILGLYLEQQDLTVTQRSQFRLSGLGLPLPFPPSTNINDFAQDGETAAAFGQLTWRMSDSWSVTGGLRFAYEKKEATLDIINADIGESESSQNPLVQLLSFQLAGRVEGTLDQERSTENWSPMVNLQWDFSDEGMAYAKYSRGFKSGGYNARVPNATLEDQFEFDDEKVDGFELGAKLTLLGGAATLNTALFYSEFTDRQVSSFLDSGFVVGNAAESTSKGLEIDGRLMASEHLMFGLSLAYLKSEYDEFENAGCAPEQIRFVDPVPGCEGGAQDLSGETTNFAPEWSGTFTTNFFYPVGDNMEFRAALDVIYTDAHYLEQGLDSNLVQDSYTKVNGRLALASSADTWEIALIGKNLNDELTNGIGAGMPFFTGSYFKSVMEPRTVALEVSYNWF
jgi:iron complex outermembrane recepter protein